MKRRQFIKGSTLGVIVAAINPIVTALEYESLTPYDQFYNAVMGQLSSAFGLPLGIINMEFSTSYSMSKQAALLRIERENEA